MLTEKGCIWGKDRSTHMPCKLWCNKRKQTYTFVSFPKTAQIRSRRKRTDRNPSPKCGLFPLSHTSHQKRDEELACYRKLIKIYCVISTYSIYPSSRFRYGKTYVPQYLAVMEYIKKGIHHPFKKLSNLSVCQQMVKDVMCVYMYFIYILYIYIYITLVYIYCAVLS